MALLEIDGLSVTIEGARSAALDAVTLSVDAGEVLGVVGESGCGKSMTGLSIQRLLPTTCRITAGQIRFDGVDLLALGEDELRRVRGAQIGMVFQEPLSALNPVFRVGDQICEPLLNHGACRRGAARGRALELLAKVGISDPRRRIDQYPHELSGGMRQRVMIAMALACRPRLLVADEPTTALDVTIQAQILTLIRDLQRELEMATVLITHDLGVVAQFTDRVAVMYAGQIVEEAPVRDIFARPAHPYTQALLASIPARAAEGERLPVIPGVVPPLSDLPPGCRFAPRCPHRRDLCAALPRGFAVRPDPNRRVACILAAPVSPDAAS